MNVASMAGRFAIPGSAVYSATKHAVVAFSEALYYEIRSTGVVVTAVNPGLVATERFPHADVPGRRLTVMPPERIAGVIVDVVRARTGSGGLRAQTARGGPGGAGPGTRPVPVRAGEGDEGTGAPDRRAEGRPQSLVEVVVREDLSFDLPDDPRGGAIVDA